MSQLSTRVSQRELNRTWKTGSAKERLHVHGPVPEDKFQLTARKLRGQGVCGCMHICLKWFAPSPEQCQVILGISRGIISPSAYAPISARQDRGHVISVITICQPGECKPSLPLKLCSWPLENLTFACRNSDCVPVEGNATTKTNFRKG